MTRIDRRSGLERRSAQRFKVTIDIEWESVAGRQPATLSDINQFGCFVLSSGEFHDGETVKIFLPLSDGKKVQFLGKVANNVFEIGFAATFIDLTAAQSDFLNKFIAMHQL